MKKVTKESSSARKSEVLWPASEISARLWARKSNEQREQNVAKGKDQRNREIRLV